MLCQAEPSTIRVYNLRHTATLNVDTTDTLSRANIQQDSLQIRSDSLQTDTLPYAISTDALESKVQYKARDSIRFDISSKKVFLFGKADIKYKKITLKAGYIEIDWTKNLLTATPYPDSTGQLQGTPVFKEGQDQYKAKKIMYNYKTKKGKLEELFTKEGEGFVHGEQVKKTPEDNLFVKNGKYTTCNLEDPHFYIGIDKLKAIPDKLLVSGPANLVIEDVPTPLFTPFGIFPLQKGQRSGIMLPEYGFDQNLGYFLKGGGYYWGVSDYMDLAIRGGIYTYGSWRLGVASNYKKRYKYNGQFSVDYSSTKAFGDDFRKKDYRIKWRHDQDRKAHPSRNFSANVNISSGDFHKVNSYETEQVLASQFQSDVTYQKNWLNSPFSLNTKLRHEQNTRTGRMNFTLPSIALNMSRVQPFKRKEVVGERKWYEQIGVNYKGTFQNRATVYDSVLFNQLFGPDTSAEIQQEESLQELLRYGVQHNIPINTRFKVFKHFNLTPSFQYSERWYWKRQEKEWLGDSVRTTVDPDLHFTPVRTFNSGLSLNTKLYGMFNFGDGKVKAMRHVLTPSLSYNYHPDFSTTRWGYFKEVQVDTLGTTEKYPLVPGKDAIFNYASRNEQGQIRLDLDNNVEMKIASKDTSKEEQQSTKKIAIFRTLNASAAYNIAADSLNLSDIRINGRTDLFNNKLDIRFGGVVDPYVIDTHGTKLDRFEWEENDRIGRLTDANLKVSAKFQSKNKKERSAQHGSQHEANYVTQHPEHYVNFNIPWRFNFSYNLIYREQFAEGQLEDNITQTFQVDAEVNITSKWRIRMQTGYNFQEEKLTYTEFNLYRDLHCWEMRFKWVPTRNSYLFTINVKSSVLQDLKLQRRRNWNDY